MLFEHENAKVKSRVPKVKIEGSMFMELLHQLECFFGGIVQYGVLFLECAGVAVLLVTAAKSVYACIRKNDHVRLQLAQGIALALEFKLGGEVLRTVIVREMSELVTLGAIILLRGAVAVLIHWEIKELRLAAEPGAGGKT